MCVKFTHAKKELEIQLFLIFHTDFIIPNFFSSSAWLRKSTTSNHIPGHHGCFKWLVASRFLVLVKPGEAVATRRHFCNLHIRSPQIMKCKSMSVAQTTHGLLSTESQIKQGQMTYEILQSKYYSNFKWNGGSQHVMFQIINDYSCTPSMCAHFHSPPRGIHTRSYNVIQFRYVEQIHLKWRKISPKEPSHIYNHIPKTPYHLMSWFTIFHDNAPNNDS